MVMRSSSSSGAAVVMLAAVAVVLLAAQQTDAQTLIFGSGPVNGTLRGNVSTTIPAIFDNTEPGQVLYFFLRTSDGSSVSNSLFFSAYPVFFIGTRADPQRFNCTITPVVVPGTSAEQQVPCVLIPGQYPYPYSPSEEQNYWLTSLTGASHNIPLKFPTPQLYGGSLRANETDFSFYSTPFLPYEFPVGQSNRTLLFLTGFNFVPDPRIMTVTYGYGILETFFNPEQPLPFMWSVTNDTIEWSQTTSTQIAFWTQAGAYGRTLDVYVTVNGNLAPKAVNGVPVRINYSNPPAIASISGCPSAGFQNQTTPPTFNPAGTHDCPTAGGNIITIRGQQLFPPMSITVGGSELCTNPYPYNPSKLASDERKNLFPCPNTLPGECLLCKMPPGTGLKPSLVLSLTPDGCTDQTGKCYTQSAQVSLLSYAPPQVFNITGCHVGTYTNVKDCRREGGDVVTLIGQNFGAERAKVLVGGSLGLNVVHNLPDKHSSISFTVPPGSGTLRSIIVLQAGGTLNGDKISISYFQCPPGTFQSGVNGLNCTDCPVGFWNPTYDAFICQMCPTGFYSGNTTGVTICRLCDPGTARSGQINTAVCDVCPPGTEQQGTGQGSCLDCPAGKYAASEGTTSCKDCDPQTFSGQKASSSCTNCSGIFFQPSKGQTSCQTCLAGQYYDGFTCHVCPAGAICDGPGGILTEGDYYVYYTVPDIIPGLSLTDARQNRVQLESVQCLPQFCGTCPTEYKNKTVNGTLVYEKDNKAFIGLKAGLVFSCCSENRPAAQDNELCGECFAGYTVYGNVCVPCSETDGAIVFLLILMQWLYVTVFHWFAQIDNADLRIFLNFIQFVFLFLAAQASNLTAWLSLFNFNILTSVSTTCVAPLTDMQSLASGIYVPIFGFALLGLNIGIHYIIWRFFRKGYCAYSICVDQKYESRNPISNMVREQLVQLRQTDSFYHVWNMYRRTFLGFLANSYTSVSQSVFTFFSCIPVRNDSFVQSYPSISCLHDPEYLRLYPLFIVLTLVLCAIPILLGFRLYLLNRDGLLFGRKDIRLIYGSVIESYAPSKYAWECWVLLRRIVLCSIALDTFPDNLPQKFTYLCMCNILFLGVHYLARPYLLSMDNYAESLSLITLTLMTLFLISAPAPLPAAYAIGLTFMSFTVAGAFAIRILFTRYEVLYRAKKEADRKRKEKELALDAPKVDLANDEDFYAAEAEAEAAVEGTGLPSPADSEGNASAGQAVSPDSNAGLQPGDSHAVDVKDEKSNAAAGGDGIELAQIKPAVGGAAAAGGGDLKNDEDFYAEATGAPAPAPAAAAAAAPAPAPPADALKNDDDFYANN